MSGSSKGTGRRRRCGANCIGGEKCNEPHRTCSFLMLPHKPYTGSLRREKIYWKKKKKKLTQRQLSHHHNYHYAAVFSSRTNYFSDHSIDHLCIFNQQLPCIFYYNWTQNHWFPRWLTNQDYWVWEMEWGRKNEPERPPSDHLTPRD